MVGCLRGLKGMAGTPGRPAAALGGSLLAVALCVSLLVGEGSEGSWAVRQGSGRVELGDFQDLSAQNELWDIERTRRAQRSKQLDISVPDNEAVVMHPVKAKARTVVAAIAGEGATHEPASSTGLWQHAGGEKQAVLGALSSIKAKLERHSRDQDVPSSARTLWRTHDGAGGSEAGSRSSFWNSVDRQEAARRNALFRVEGRATGQGGSSGAWPQLASSSEPDASGGGGSSAEAAGGPKPMMSIKSEIEHRRGDENFNKQVTSMMKWNGDKMKVLISTLKNTRETIRKQRQVCCLRSISCIVNISDHPPIGICLPLSFSFFPPFSSLLLVPCSFFPLFQRPYTVPLPIQLPKLDPQHIFCPPPYPASSHSLNMTASAFILID